MKDFLIFLGGLNKKYHKILAFIVFLILVTEGLGILMPYFSGRIIDGITNPGELKSFIPVVSLIGTYLLVLFFEKFLIYMKSRYEIKNFYFDFRPDSYKEGLLHFFSFSAGEHSSTNSHNKATVLNKGVSSGQTLMTIMIFQVIPFVFMLVMLLLMLFFVGPVYGFILLGSLSLNIFFQIRVTSRLLSQFYSWEEKSKDKSKVIGEHLRNVDLTKTMGAEDIALGEVMESIKGAESFGKELITKFDRRLSLIGLLNPITIGLLLLVASWQTYVGSITVGQFIMVVSWGGMAISNIARVQWFQRNIMREFPGFRDFRSHLKEKSILEHAEHPFTGVPKQGMIVYDHVSYRYQNEGKDTFELNDVSFTIPAGKKVALAGVSGSGKTTLVSLLLRNFDPAEGAILIDGYRLKDLDLSDYQSRIGYVSQETRLFDTTVRHNLTYGLRKELSDEDLLSALDIANMKEKILETKDGLDSRIGEQGVKLSGGERQRLAIARAILRDPKILIFDEATSNLDAINEREIQNAIDRAAEGRTSVMIAHRLSTVINADIIFFFEKGRLVATGNHVELLQKSESYKELCSHQYLDVA